MAAPPGASSAKDPICGKPVDPLRARAVGIFGGVTYYFCSPECKAQFRDPRQSDRRAPRPAAAAPVGNSTPAKLPALQPELFPPASPSPTLETWAKGAPPEDAPDDDDDDAPDEAAASQPPASPSIVADLAAAKPRRGPWLMVAIVAMLGAVVFFSLRYFGKL